MAVGHEVRAFLHYNSRNSWGWLDDNAVAENIDIRLGDIRDFDAVEKAMRGCDGVLHLAALIGIPYSYESPLAYIRTNIEGTYNVLQAAREQNLGQVLITSTSETYGTAQTVPISESHPLVGQSPYSATKISADQLAISYFRSFGVPVKIVRPFNTFGPRQSARAIIPTIIAQILAGAREIKLGNLDPTRDLTFVKDTATAFLAILDANAELAGEATNIGTGEEISMRDLAHKIAAIMGVEIKLIEDAKRVRPEKSEVERLLCDASRLRKATGWRPKFTLDAGLSETISFLRQNQGLYKPQIYNV